MKHYILSLDLGTTSTRAILFDRSAQIACTTQHEITQFYPADGWVEQDPFEILRFSIQGIHELLAQCSVDPASIAAIGITNQRETTIVWNRITGEPVYNAIVWQCRRTAPICESLKAEGWTDYIRQTTGLIPDAYFSATKVKWILDHVEGARARAERGELLFGTVDTWLIWNLTGGKTHATDYTNASRTMMYDIRKLDWDERILTRLGIPRALLPEVRASSGTFGTTTLGSVEVPIAGVAGDQQAALFGQGCFEPGEAKNTYGTGCFLLVNTGSEPILSQNGLITTIAADPCGKISYALEGSVFVGGAVIQWLRDGLGLLNESRQAEALAQSVEDSGGVYVVPAFTGLGAPYWDMYARGTIVGITRGTTREHLVRAAEECIAFQSCDLVHAMEEDLGFRLKALKVDGGASRDSLLMQIQSDLLDLPIRRPKTLETTALGACFLAGLAVGFWKSTAEILRLLADDVCFEPSEKAVLRRKQLPIWHRAVERSLCWAEPERSESDAAL